MQRRNTSGRTLRMFVLPALVAMLVIMVAPMLFSVFISLNDVHLLHDGGKFTFIGLGNYISMLKDPRVWNALRVTVLFFVLALAMETFLGLAISMMLDRQFLGRSFFKSMIIIPMFMTPVVAGLIWRVFFDPLNGMINWLLGGYPHDWLGNMTGAFLCTVFVDIWQWTPFMILMFTAALDGVNSELYEAARVEGANEWNIIRSIKLPMLKNTIFVVCALRGIDLLKAFDVIYVMTKGGPAGATETITMYSYLVGFNYFRIGYATAIVLLFAVVVTIILSIVIKRMQEKLKT